MRFAGNITAIRSPPGHRRLRKVRSRARASLRKGAVPPLRKTSEHFTCTTPLQWNNDGGCRSLHGRTSRRTRHMVARGRPQVAALVGCLLTALAQTAAGAPDLSHVQWSCGRQGCEQAPAAPGPSRGQSDGYQTQDLQSAVNMTRKAEAQGSQAAHRLCHCSRAMGSCSSRSQRPTS